VNQKPTEIIAQTANSAYPSPKPSPKKAFKHVLKYFSGSDFDSVHPGCGKRSVFEIVDTEEDVKRVCSRSPRISAEIINTLRVIDIVANMPPLKIDHKRVMSEVKRRMNKRRSMLNRRNSAFWLDDVSGGVSDTVNVVISTPTDIVVQGVSANVAVVDGNVAVEGVSATTVNVASGSAIATNVNAAVKVVSASTVNVVVDDEIEDGEIVDDEVEDGEIVDDSVAAADFAVGLSDKERQAFDGLLGCGQERLF
jgi:hypothetical protein